LKYQNFDLEAFDHKNTANADIFKVRVAASSAGEQRMAEAEKATLPVSVRQRMGALQRRQLSLSEMISLGEDLGKALFPPAVRSILRSCLNNLRQDEEGLRIRLKLDTYALAEIPWEYVYLPSPDITGEHRGIEGFLVLNRLISLVRYELQQTPLVSLDPGVRPLKLVAFMASPEDPQYGRLDLDKEQNNIQQALADIPAIQPVFYPHATADMLLDVLLKPAHIFHFSGHGEFRGNMGERYGSQEGAGAVILLDDKGGARPFSAQKLTLNLTGHGIRLAVLTACEAGQRDAHSAWAGVVSALTNAGIPAVVGMQYSIRDSNAITFSRAFYRALAAGQPVDSAVLNGRLAIMNCGEDNERDWGVPVLYLRSVDGVLFPQDNSQPDSPKQPTSPGGQVNLRQLREAMCRYFSVEELEVLCSDIQDSLARSGTPLPLSLDVVGGTTREIKVLNLINYLDHRGFLDVLVKAVREARPGTI
jgi:hypothetical protein